MIVLETLRNGMEKLAADGSGGTVAPAKFLVRGALVYVPSLQGVKKVIVVKDVPLYRDGKSMPLESL